MIAMSRGEFAEQRACAQRAASICRGRGDLVRLSIALSIEAQAQWSTGDAVGAMATIDEAVAIVRRFGEPTSAVHVLPMAALAFAGTQPERSRAFVREAVELAEQLGQGWDAQIWNVIGNVAARLGDRREALGFYERGIDGWHWLGWRPFLGLTITCIGDLLAPDGRDRGGGPARRRQCARARRRGPARERGTARWGARGPRRAT